MSSERRDLAENRVRPLRTATGWGTSTNGTVMPSWIFAVQHLFQTLLRNLGGLEMSVPAYLLWHSPGDLYISWSNLTWWWKHLISSTIRIWPSRHSINANYVSHRPRRCSDIPWEQLRSIWHVLRHFTGQNPVRSLNGTPNRGISSPRKYIYFYILRHDFLCTRL